jgi:F0F1-type ATP synthase assembly protein I
MKKKEVSGAWLLGGLIVGVLVGLAVAWLINQNIHSQDKQLNGRGVAEVVGVAVVVCVILARSVRPVARAGRRQRPTVPLLQRADAP